MVDISSVNPAQIKISKKGQGITQALKAFVEKNKMKLSDGSISAAEWKETIKVLDGIQNERKANNKASIFGNNYVVHQNAEIDFTAEEMEKIYTAMGVEFKKNTETQASPQTQQTQQAPHAQQVLQTPQETVKPTEAEKIKYIGSEELPKDTVDKREGNSTVTYVKDGKKLLSRETAGLNIEDGKTYNTTYYGEDGKPVGTAAASLKDGFIVYEFKDENGNVCGTAKVSGGREEVIVMDANGKEIKHEKNTNITKEMLSQTMDDMFQTFPFVKTNSVPSQVENLAELFENSPNDLHELHQLDYSKLEKYSGIENSMSNEQKREAKNMYLNFVSNAPVTSITDGSVGIIYVRAGFSSDTKENLADDKIKPFAQTMCNMLVSGKAKYIELLQGEKDFHSFQDSGKASKMSSKDWSLMVNYDYWLSAMNLELNENGEFAKKSQ